eukprot:gene1390-1756_t
MSKSTFIILSILLLNIVNVYAQFSGKVPMVQNALVNVRASTFFGSGYEPFNAVLNSLNPGSQSAWSAYTNDLSQYIIATTPVPRNFVGISVQGRPIYAQWITGYRIQYSLNNVDWYWYNGGATIVGTTGSEVIASHTFISPIWARSIKLLPVTWESHISLRWELYADEI